MKSASDIASDDKLFKVSFGVDVHTLLLPLLANITASLFVNLKQRRMVRWIFYNQVVVICVTTSLHAHMMRDMVISVYNRVQHYSTITDILTSNVCFCSVSPVLTYFLTAVRLP